MIQEVMVSQVKLTNTDILSMDNLANQGSTGNPVSLDNMDNLASMVSPVDTASQRMDSQAMENPAPIKLDRGVSLIVELWILKKQNDWFTGCSH